MTDQIVTVSALRGYPDYDRESLPLLTQAQRIEYFERRVRMVGINPLRRLLRTEIIVDDAEGESSAILIFGVSLCCAIEAAASASRAGTTRTASGLWPLSRRT